jgi:oligo-1,6-glucosidase
MPKFGGWNTVYLENHDSGRSISRYASDRPEHRANSSKLFATYLCSLSGTPFLLAGQEIAKANLGKDYGIEAYVDVEGRNYYHSLMVARGGDESKMRDVPKRCSASHETMVDYQCSGQQNQTQDSAHRKLVLG